MFQLLGIDVTGVPGEYPEHLVKKGRTAPLLLEIVQIFLGSGRDRLVPVDTQLVRVLIDGTRLFAPLYVSDALFLEHVHFALVQHFEVPVDLLVEQVFHLQSLLPLPAQPGWLRVHGP